jgi:hypothetical protein
MAPLLAIGLLSVLPGQYRPHIFEPSQFEHMAAYIGAATALAFIYAPELKAIRVVVFLGAFGPFLKFSKSGFPAAMPPSSTSPPM